MPRQIFINTFQRSGSHALSRFISKAYEKPVVINDVDMYTDNQEKYLRKANTPIEPMVDCEITGFLGADLVIVMIYDRVLDQDEIRFIQERGGEIYRLYRHPERLMGSLLQFYDSNKVKDLMYRYLPFLESDFGKPVFYEYFEYPDQTANSYISETFGVPLGLVDGDRIGHGIHSFPNGLPRNRKPSWWIKIGPKLLNRYFDPQVLMFIPIRKIFKNPKNK